MSWFNSVSLVNDWLNIIVNHDDFVLCDIGWLDDGFYILLQSNEKASVWLLLKDKEQEEMQYVLNDIQCLLSWHILKSKILPHLVVHPTLGALLEPEWAKDDPGDVDQLQGELLISWSSREILTMPRPMMVRVPDFVLMHPQNVFITDILIAFLSR